MVQTLLLRSVQPDDSRILTLDRSKNQLETILDSTATDSNVFVYEMTVLDTRAEPHRASHEKYTSNYILVGRQKTSAGVHLLQEIDLLFQPDP